jgi:hypothetical protein
MKYDITGDVLNWPKATQKALPYSQYADCNGELKIAFSHKGQERDYQNETVNIPLFLTEFEDFLNRVDSVSPQEWYVGFAPFAYGLLSEGSLQISSRSGKAFSPSVYDTTSLDDLARLKARVAKDISKFGRVLMGAAS